MKSYNLNTARASLTDLVNEVAYGKERITITRRNRPLAVVVPVEDAELLERLEDEIDIREADKVLKEKGRAIDWAEAEKQLDRAKKRKGGR